MVASNYELQVSAVVVNFNGGDRVIECIRALDQLTSPLAAIIVVDNGSTDESPKHISVQFPGVQLLTLGENRGLSVARNTGLRLVTTELALLIDHDLYVSKDCLNWLTKAYAESHATVVCPRIRLIPERHIVQADGAAVHFVGTMVLRHGFCAVEDAPAIRTAVTCFPGGCLLINSERALAAGGFDEAYFFYFEDLEFSVRLCALGDLAVCEPAAVVYHDRGSGVPDLAFRGRGAYPSRRAYLTMRNRLMTIIIHYRMRTLLLLSPMLILYEMVSLTATVLLGWGWAWPRAWIWILTNMRSIRKRRQRIQEERLQNDRDFLVGGALPLAPGVIRSRPAKFGVAMLALSLNAYWRVVQRWIG